MHPILFRIGKVSVYSYGFMMALGIAVAVVGMRRMFKQNGYPEEKLYDLALVAVISGLIGSRLFYVVFYAWDAFLENPLMFFDLQGGGLVFYGSFLGGLVGGIVYLWRQKMPFWEVADMAAPYLALAYAIGRVGCFLNGCCYGKPTSLPWGVVFPGIGGVARHPTQIYSSLAALGLFVFLSWLYSRRHFSGQVFLCYVAGYALIRFIIEFWRENLVLWAGLTVGQVMALAAILLTLPFYMVLKRGIRHG